MSRVGDARPVLPARVVVVDDHRMFTDALSDTLSDEPDLRLVAAFPCAGRTLAEDVLRARPDVVVLDVEPLRPAAASELIERIVAGRPPGGVMVLASVDDLERVVAAARAGALGWLSKRASTAELLAAIRAVGAGHGYYSREHLGDVLRGLVGDRRRIERTAPGPLAVLSRQERRVLAGMVDGERGPQIAARLHLSVGTVRTHTQNIFAKLGVHSRLEAVTVARKAGLPACVTGGE